MILKKHNSAGRLVLAICDDNLIGKEISDDKSSLNLASVFFAGEQMKEEEILPLMKKAYIINAVGNACVGLLKKEGYIEEKNVGYIKKTPHAQVVNEAKR